MWVVVGYRLDELPWRTAYDTLEEALIRVRRLTANYDHHRILLFEETNGTTGDGRLS